jgi:hypothetical protein
MSRFNVRVYAVLLKHLRADRTDGAHHSPLKAFTEQIRFVIFCRYSKQMIHLGAISKKHNFRIALRYRFNGLPKRFEIVWQLPAID